MIVVGVQNLVGKMISVVVNETCQLLTIRWSWQFGKPPVSSLPAVGNSFKPEQTA